MVGPLSLCCCWESSQHLRCCAVQSVGLGGPVAASFRGHGGLGQVKGPCQSLSIFRATSQLPFPPPRVRWGLRHVGMFPNDSSDEGSVSPNSRSPVSRPAAPFRSPSFSGRGKKRGSHSPRNALGPCGSLWAAWRASREEWGSLLRGQERGWILLSSFQGCKREVKRSFGTKMFEIKVIARKLR